MRILRFRARTMQEALRQVRDTLGPDAVILGSRTLAPPFRWLGREQVEVVAASESRAEARRASAADAEGLAPLLAEVAAVSRGTNGKHRGASVGGAFAGSRALRDTPDLESEIRDIRDALGRLMAWTAPKDQSVESVVAQLVETGLSNELARELVDGSLGLPESEIWAHVRNNIRARVAVAGTGDLLAMSPRSGRRCVVALVGPTGVGKTTTLAKLAAKHALVERRSVGMVTLDTYRVAAVDQIRTYTQMMDLPLEVVVSAEDVQPALHRLASCELVLVDTIGHGPNDELHLGQMRMLLRAIGPAQVHLVLAATTDRRTMANALQRFARLEPTHLLFTKLDEAVAFGPMVEASMRAGWPVSYLSYGQDVPERISPATAEQLAAAVCPEEA